MARVLGAVAANESAGKSATGHAQERAGRRRRTPHTADHAALRLRSRQDHRRSQKRPQIYRTLVARFLAGESRRSLATWLNEQQVPTVTGAGG